MAPTPSRRLASSPSLAGAHKYVRFTPLLLMAALSYSGVAWLVTHIPPERVQNWLLPDSYLPFHIPLFLGNFFLCTFVTLSKRWGILIALTVAWLFFLKLQGFTLDLWAWGSALLLGGGGYALRTWWKKRV